jgi:BirA family transcriptional regulator, biotin operon repressor / biotin---[acetyl-CoA-carboxylase] ligase
MPIGSKLYRTHTTDNSMAWAKENIHDAPDGAIFLADVYTKAHGRHGRSWDIHPGQLMVTFILKPTMLKLIHADDLAIRLNQLNMALCLGIQEPLKKWGVQLKWPNDFVLNGKKLGGLLTHMVWHGQDPVGLIVGFGLNINNQFQDSDPLRERAISLLEATGTNHELKSLYRELLSSLNIWYNQWQLLNVGLIYKQWRLEQAFLGKEISIHQKDGSLVEGTATQVMPNGDMLLKETGGKQLVVSFYQVEDIQLA